MKKIIYLILFSIILLSCRDKRDTDKRILELGTILVEYSQKADSYNHSKQPQEIAIIGKSAF